jgi:hypothetical protein
LTSRLSTRSSRPRRLLYHPSYHSIEGIPPLALPLASPLDRGPPAARFTSRLTTRSRGVDLDFTTRSRGSASYFTSPFTTRSSRFHLSLDLSIEGTSRQLHSIEGIPPLALPLASPLDRGELTWTLPLDRGDPAAHFTSRLTTRSRASRCWIYYLSYHLIERPSSCFHHSIEHSSCFHVAG